MKKMRLARLILQPSAGGLLGIIGLSSFIMVASGLSYVSKNGLLYEYLFGAGSSSALIETSKSTITLFSETVFGNTILNKILFFAFWMIIGLFVYLFISSLGAGANAAGRVAREAQYVNGDSAARKYNLKLRVILRAISLGVWLIYNVFFFKIFLPFGILCARITAGNLSEPLSWLYGLLGFLVLCGSFYLHVVLLRFVLLRLRIFGGDNELLLARLKR